MSALPQKPHEQFIDKYFAFNFTVNVIDGGFFGLGIGFASFVSVIPLFVSSLTDSAVLIGLIPAIHTAFWQLPQLLMSKRVSRLRKYKPMVVRLTFHERAPFLGLALVAWLAPSMDTSLTLALVFLLLIWQGLGGGITATAWQSMIGKIIPGDRWGLFYGTQSALLSMLAVPGAILAGRILERMDSPLDFTLCFLLASAAIFFSWIFIALTREDDSDPLQTTPAMESTRKYVGVVLRRDVNFRWFLIVRILYQLSLMGIAFYIVYAVRSYGASEGTAGLLTGLMLVIQILINPVVGWLGDRWSHRYIVVCGALAAFGSALLAWWAGQIGWFFLVFLLAGMASTVNWTTSLAMLLKFGSESERPIYIGMANTLIAPFVILAPIFGGWVADTAGYQATFFISAIFGLITAGVALFKIQGVRGKDEPVSEII